MFDKKILFLLIMLVNSFFTHASDVECVIQFDDTKTFESDIKIVMVLHIPSCWRNMILNLNAAFSAAYTVSVHENVNKPKKTSQSFKTSVDKKEYLTRRKSAGSKKVDHQQISEADELKNLVLPSKVASLRHIDPQQKAHFPKGSTHYVNSSNVVKKKAKNYTIKH